MTFVDTSFFLRILYDTLAQAIHHSSVHEWQRALDTLPKENLTPGELKQREQYQHGLKNAKAVEAAAQATHVGINVRAGTEMPWDVAGRMIPALRSQEMAKSSVSCPLPMIIDCSILI
jgi:hypothetical protein